MAEYTITNRRDAVNFEIGDNPVLRTIQNCKNLLLTKMGEVPYDRYRGFDWALYHLPIEKMREALLPELDRLMLWEPDAEVKAARADMDGNGEILITVTIEVGA